MFLTFRGPLASHDSNPYPNRSRIARYKATKLECNKRVHRKLLPTTFHLYSRQGREYRRIARQSPIRKTCLNGRSNHSRNCRASQDFRVLSKLGPRVVFREEGVWVLVAHDCGDPLSRYTCCATRVAADFLDFIAFCRCSSGVAPHPPKILVSHFEIPPPHSREVSHRNLGLKRCRATRECRRYSCGCRATLCN